MLLHGFSCVALRESVFLQWRVGHFNPHPEPVRLSQFDTGFGGKSRPGVQSQIRTTMYVVRCPCGMKLSWGKYVEDGETGAGHLRMTWCDEEHMTQEKCVYVAAVSNMKEQCMSRT